MHGAFIRKQLSSIQRESNDNDAWQSSIVDVSSSLVLDVAFVQVHIFLLRRLETMLKLIVAHVKRKIARLIVCLFVLLLLHGLYGERITITKRAVSTEFDGGIEHRCLGAKQ